MTISLAKGVNLHVIPSEKFKTVSIKIKFTAPLKVENMTKRSLIAQLLETNSKHYPTQTDFRKALSELYGAHFGAGVSKKGLLHPLTVSLSVVNDRYLSEGGVTKKAIEFLHSVLLHPHVFHDAFHQETFDREVKNLKDEFDARYDNKQLYANLALKELYFEDEAQKIPSNGRLKELEECTAENVFAAYKQMIKEDQIDIYVLGDIDKEEIERAFRTFAFKDREELDSALFYKQEKREKQEKTEEQTVIQAKLNLGFDTGVYYHQENYYAGQVFNGIFGGYPHSKLFMNVREKQSLAYYASSQLDTFRGTMFVQSGIDQAQAAHVEDVINQQLQAIQQGEFAEETISQTKEMLKNSLYQSGDSAHSMIELRYAMDLIGQSISIEEWVRNIEKVTKEEIVQVAKQTNQQASYLLKGVDGNAE